MYGLVEMPVVPVSGGLWRDYCGEVDDLATKSTKRHKKGAGDNGG
jgi:hypothetical protein